VDREVWPPPVFIWEGKEWIDYEKFKRALLLKTVPGEVGELLVAFPAGVCEDNRPHLHPSGRVITVLYGSGSCVIERMGDPIKIDLTPKTRLWLPEDTLHIILAGQEPMLIHSQHVPWVPFEDQKCLTYPEEATRQDRLLSLVR
jgi:hypothetical protein